MSLSCAKGPVFANIVLADEINRASPKTQSALLEAMQEGQVTIEGETLPLPTPFLVLATQNPIEYEGTFPLPEAQLDRFMLKLAVGYPSMEEEKLILRRRRERRQDEVALREITQASQVLEMREAVETIHVNADLENYIASLVHATRVDRRVLWARARAGHWRSSRSPVPMPRSKTVISSHPMTSSVMRFPYWVIV